MSIEGLDFILNKQEVVPTVSASDLLEHTERVEDDYNRHVRTYVPINRAAEGQEGELSVEEFERKVIKAVKDAKAPRGYLTAEYGYGKTSTALYLWKRAEEQNLIVVPPFQMLHLADLVTAIYGWVRYRLNVHSPQLVPLLEDLYENTTNRNLDQEAQKHNINLATLEDLVRQGRYILDLQPSDFIQYFEQVTEIVLQAGFEGVLVLADEIQQYIEPRVKSSKDPIAPLFNLIQMLLTRENYLQFGLILIIGRKEIGLIRESRNDLLHRMRKLSLDLTNVYDYEFAIRLWQMLAREFEFNDIARDITTDEALEALGQIASRTDLSDGPRTVINTFRRMVERYKTFGVSTPPYTPIDLVDDLISGDIQFAGNDQIQNVTRRALQNDIVRNAFERYERAIKLAAAYPASGVPFRTQQKFDVDKALDDLMRLALGEIVINVGLPENRGITLFGLHEGIQKTDWLSQTIRDFRRSYGEHHDITHQRAVKMFAKILKEVVFKDWTLIDEYPSNFTSNFSLILQGNFQAFSGRYPRRQVHVRIFWEDEELKDATINGDVAIEYYLTICPGLQDDPDNRRKDAHPVVMERDNHVAMIPINLMYVRAEGIPPQILSQLEGVWSPYDLSPLVLMNIYQMLEEKRADSLIPQQDDQFIRSAFQPELMYNIVRDLFNAEIGEPFGGVSQGRITEVAVEELLDHRYRDTYKTIIAQSNWRNWLNRYSNAIAQLDNLYQKRGEVEVEDTKEKIAQLLTSSNTGLDQFIKTFGAFLSVSRDWKGGNVGAVLFTLHDLEALIVQWLRDSDRTERVQIGGKSFEVHVLNVSDIYDRAHVLGYQTDEIEALLNLLERREMLEFYQKHRIREIPSQSVDLDNVAVQIRDFSREVEALLRGFSNSSQLLDMQSQAENWQSALEKERQSGTPDPQRVHRLSRNIQFRQNELRKFAQDKQTDVDQQVTMLMRNLRPINPQHLNFLNNLIEGSVSYVEQVNVLRTHLRNHANNIKSKVDRAHTQIEGLKQAVGQADLSYEGLARCAQEISGLSQELQNVNDDVNQFETMYRNLLDWQRLVNDGSQLLNEMQQMGHLAASYQDGFDQLSRDIRADISSAGSKLSILPNHSVYSAPLANLAREVREIRRDAEDDFINLQNRYYQMFTGNGLYTRERIGRSFEYNVSNPNESYRLLHERVQRLTSEFHSQITKVIRERQNDIRNILGTPLLGDLVERDRDQIEDEGNDLIRLADECLGNLLELEKHVNDITVIRDFPSEGVGNFQRVVDELLSSYQVTRNLIDGAKRLSQWLTDISLSSEEETVLAHLRSEDLEAATDILDWLHSTRMNPDNFWNVMRGLYEKHRIRILVTRVRR